MVKLVNAAQMRSENAADWAGIGGAIGVAAHSAKHRADVEAGAAADAMQHVALFDIREQFASAIVEQYDMEFFGPIWTTNWPVPNWQSLVSTSGRAPTAVHGSKN